MSEDPYRQLHDGVRCFRCAERLAGDRKAYFRFDPTGTRVWCCGAADCLRSFFEAGRSSKTKQVYELDEEDVFVLDAAGRQVRKRFRG